LIAVEDVFDRELAADPRFRDAVAAKLARVYAVGSKRAVEESVAA
jgi:hypothetical protein